MKSLLDGGSSYTDTDMWAPDSKPADTPEGRPNPDETDADTTQVEAKPDETDLGKNENITETPETFVMIRNVEKVLRTMFTAWIEGSYKTSPPHLLLLLISSSPPLQPGWKVLTNLVVPTNPSEAAILVL